MNVLIADVIQFVSGTMTSFSQGGATKIKSKQFLEFGFRTTKPHLNSCERIYSIDFSLFLKFRSLDILI